MEEIQAYKVCGRLFEDKAEAVRYDATENMRQELFKLMSLSGISEVLKTRETIINFISNSLDSVAPIVKKYHEILCKESVDKTSVVHYEGKVWCPHCECSIRVKLLVIHEKLECPHCGKDYFVWYNTNNGKVREFKTDKSRESDFNLDDI